jgi:Domain of unknown function (DUF4868)
MPDGVGRDPDAALAAAASSEAVRETRATVFIQRQGGDLEGLALNPDAGLAEDFRIAALSSSAASMSGRELTPYVPGRKPDDHEAPWISAAEVPELASILDQAEGPPLPLFNGDSPEARHARLLVVSIRRVNPGWAHYISTISPKARLRRRGAIAAVLSGAVYTRLESDVLLFERSFDGIVSEGILVMLNQREVERGLRFLERAGPAAVETLTIITTQLKIQNLAALLDAAGQDINIIAKLRGIQAKMAASPVYAQAMTMERVVQFVKSRPDLHIDLIGDEGREELIFYPDPARRWRILKLLDDDYLHSQLTDIDYEANSKSIA